MQFSIGTKVKLRFTGESGVVTARIGDDLLQVRLDSDPSLEIPAFEEDLLPAETASPTAGAAYFMPGANTDKPAPPPRRVLKSQYHVLKPKGLQLAFEPMPGRDEFITRYKAWMINDTPFDFLMEFDLYTNKRDVISLDDKLQAASALELGDFQSDDLNEAPEAWLRVQRITTEGTEEALEITFRIRPKQFFNSLITAPILNVLAYQFVLLDNFEKADEKEPEEDIRTYAKQQRRNVREGNNSVRFKAFDPEAFAGFDNEIDLHIQNLMNGYARLDKGEIVRIQMIHFQAFLDKAIRLGVPRIFVIHGVGEGKLKEAIAQRLKENPHVVKFKNEYHHKYGYGATEVILE